MTTIPANNQLERAALLLKMLLVREARLDIFCRTHDGFGFEEHQVTEVDPPALPAHLLRILEASSNWWEMHTSQYALQSSNVPIVRCLAARWLTAPEFTGYRYVVSTKRTTEIADAVGSFGLVPSAVIDAGVEVVALWQLDRPIHVADATALQERLAAALGASTSERDHCHRESLSLLKDTDPQVPIAFFGVIREFGNAEPNHVNIDHIDASAEYSIGDVEKAIKERR